MGVKTQTQSFPDSLITLPMLVFNASLVNFDPLYGEDSFLWRKETRICWGIREKKPRGHLSPCVSWSRACHVPEYDGRHKCDQSRDHHQPEMPLAIEEKEGNEGATIAKA